MARMIDDLIDYINRQEYLTLVDKQVLISRVEPKPTDEERARAIETMTGTKGHAWNG